MDEWLAERRLFWALLASLLVHIAALSLLRSPWLAFATPQNLLPIEVDLAPVPEPAPPAAARAQDPQPQPPKESREAQETSPDLTLPERQIVSPPDAGEEAPPKNTRLLSDRDNRVREETIRRAERYENKTERSLPAETMERSQQADNVHATGAARRADNDKGRSGAGQQVASLPKLEQLLPSLGDVPLGGAAPPPTPADADGSATARPRRFLLDASGPTFALQPGTADFLPGIREGNITLLNTKAERFAPFVRRVAARVFQHLDIRLRQTARAGTASAGREYAVVEAIMDRRGQLVRARVVERQSTSTFGADRVLLSVTTPETFFDANPPAGAEASDGYIHFLLLIDLDVVAVPDPRTGRTAVGYRGIAGVGLDALADRRH